MDKYDYTVLTAAVLVGLFVITFGVVQVLESNNKQTFCEDKGYGLVLDVAEPGYVACCGFYKDHIITNSACRAFIYEGDGE